jgi:hypothetical protein
MAATSANKSNELSRYSDMTAVLMNAHVYLGPNADIRLSTRKDKKYMVRDPNGKYIHFGTMNPPMEDYTKHRDDRRLELFRKRNARWKKSPKYSPAWLSYWLLWT